MTNTKPPTEFPADAQWYCLDADPQPRDAEGHPILWTRVVVLGAVDMGERVWYRFLWNDEEQLAHPGDLVWDVS